MKKWFVVLAALWAAFAGAPALAQTITPDFFGMSVEYTDVTSWPKLYAGHTRDWYSDCSGSPANMNNVFPTSITPTWTGLDCVVANYGAHVGANQIYTFGLFPGWCNGSTTADVPCTLETNYHSMVNLISARYVGRIRYWEPLNEVNLPGAPTTGWYSGTPAQVITMASDVYSTVKTNDPSAVVLSPSVEGPTGPAYMLNLLSLGLGSYFDVYNWHGYPFNTFPNTFPEQTAYIAQTMAHIAKMYSQDTKPVFVDEGGYPPGVSAALQPAFTSVYLVSLASAGVSRVTWFQFDNGNGFGVLSDGASFLNPAGIAYRETQKWLIGSTFTSNWQRTAGTNLIRNPTSSGASAGSPGTPPTDWSVYAPDRTHGITDQVIGTCSDGTRSGIDWQVAGTVTSGASGQADLFFEAGNQIATTQGAQRQVGAYVRLDGGSTANVTVSLNENEDDSGGSYLGTDMDWVFPPLNDTLANDQITYFGRATHATAAYEQPYLQVAYSTTVGTVVNIEMCVAAPSDDNGTDWAATITKPGGYQAQIVEDSHGDVAPSTYTFPSGQGYVGYRDLTGVSRPLVGTTVQLTNQPIIIENTTPKGLVL